MSRPPNRRGAPPAGNEGAPFDFIALGSNDGSKHSPQGPRAFGIYRQNAVGTGTITRAKSVQSVIALFAGAAP